MNATGQIGELRVGYQRAARLGAWRLAPKMGTAMAYTFTARVLDVNDHWIEQEPLSLVLTVGRTEWLWRGVTITRDGAELHIDLTEAPIIERAASAVR